MHVRKAAAIGVERDPRAAGPAGRPGDAGGGVAFGDEGAGLAARDKAEIFEAVDREMREACPWQRTGGVVDRQVVDVIVGDAGLGKGLGAATRNAREDVKSSIWLTIGVSTLSPVPRR